ncbi:DUF771 domain-containing protein [Jeotgalibaca porci]|uniref:DUF771 domain-containing protein n=1 Tax=Jeotgalibaca porci TaxID=1868793 RepID=UPI0035A17012
MEQTLEVQIKIPSEYVLIRKEYLKELEDSSMEGQWWDLKDLMQRINSKDPKWVRENILEPYRQQLDVLEDGLRIVFYPSPGQKWKFNATGMKTFLDSRFPEIWANE